MARGRKKFNNSDFNNIPAIAETIKINKNGSFFQSV